MIRFKIFLFLFLIVSETAILSQVKIRLFADQSPESAIFSVTEGNFILDAYNGEVQVLTKGELLLISRYNGKLAIKTSGSQGFVCDSVCLKAKTGEDSFSLRINGKSPVRQSYCGDLQCYPDLGTLLFINGCNIESYIAGVVKAEGGSGKNIGYFKTQAVIARTYTYKYLDKHIADRYNLCDNTHCQAFNGTTNDSVIVRAALETAGLVILAPDSTLIISAFHSNCGGETSPSEDVWLTGQPYLKKVVDPYCLSSRNAIWQKKIALNEWTGYLKKMGYTGSTGDVSLLNFSQTTRSGYLTTGTFHLPLQQIRKDMNLRSTFFSVSIEGDSVILKGRGYGHGVGLCQEGAMVMASKGFDYKQIIDFYYKGVIISDIRNAKTDNK